MSSLHDTLPMYLTAGLKSQAEMVAEEECRTRALYEMAKSLSGALDVPQVAQISQTFLRDVAQLQVTLLLPDTEGKLKPFGDHEVWTDRKSTRLNSSHQCASRLPSSA